MRNKKFKALTVVALSSLMLCSCTTSDVDDMMKMSKSAVVTKYRELETAYKKTFTAYTDSQSEISKLKEKMAGIYGEDVVDAGIVSIGDGSGRFTFNSVNNLIAFEKALTSPYSEATESSGSVTIVTGVKIRVPDSWYMSLSGSSLQLSNKSGISGEIKVTNISNYIEGSDYKKLVLEPWTEQLPKTTMNYNSLFIDGSVVGSQVDCTTYVDKKDSYLYAGAFGNGDISILYTFVYQGKKDGTKDDLIKGLLSTLSINDSVLSFEK